MADVEQEIKVKVKGILEGFEGLKKIKSDLSGLSSQKITISGKADAEALATALGKANSEGKGFASTVFSVVSAFGSMGEGVQGVIKLLEFFGVSGNQVKAVMGGVFKTIKAGAGEATGFVQQLFASFNGGGRGAAGGAAGGGALSGLSNGISSIGQSVRGAIPALTGGAAGIAGITAAALTAVVAIAAVAAAVVALVAAIGGIVLVGTAGSAALLALAQSGFDYLDKLEQIEIGTGALIAQLGEIKRDGIALTGIDAVQAGIELGRAELAKLRVEAIQTTATYGELAEAFQAAVGSGLGAGLSLDEIRQFTVGMAQAGAALGVPYAQLRQEVNSILEGTIDMNSRIAKNLGITNEEVKAWKQKGTLAAELNKRLEGFRSAGILAANSLSGIKSNLQEALNVISGEATVRAFETLKTRAKKILDSIFDFNTGGINAAFKPLATLIDKFLVQGIERFADWLETAVGWAKQLGGFIDNNRAVIDDILDLIDAITRETVAILIDFVNITAQAGFWQTILSNARSVLTGIHGVVVIIRQMSAAIAFAWSLVGNFILTRVNPAVLQLLSYIPGLQLLVGLLNRISAGANPQGGGLKAEAGGSIGQLTVGGGKRVGGGGGGGKRGGGRDSLTQLLESQDDLERTRISNAVNEYLQKLKSTEDEVEALFEARKMSTRQYFDERGKIAKRELDAEIVKERNLLALAEAKLARTKDAAERNRAQGEVEQIESRIAVLIDEVGRKQKENERDRQKAVEALNLEYAELANTLNEFKGLGFEADVARLNEKYREILERATADGNEDVVKIIEGIKKYETALIKLTDNEKKYNLALDERDDKLTQIDELLERGLIDELEASNRRVQIEREYKGELLDVIDAQIALAKAAEQYDKVIALTAARRKIALSGDKTTPQLLAEEQAKFDRLRAALSLAENAVNAQVNTGAITQELGDVKRLEIQRQMRTELEKSVAVMRELAAATASLDDDIAVENLALEIAQLGEATDTLGKGIIDALRTGIGGFFDSLISGTQSVKQAFAGLVSSILQSMAKLAANELLRSLFSSGIFKSGGALGFLGGLKFAEGGYVSGPGTTTSDSIPALLSDKEYVVKASAVKRLGVGYLNYLNGGGNPFGALFGRFAGGGLVTKDGSGGAEAGAGAGASNGVRIINVIDPNLVSDYLGTSGGESAILNVLKRNPAFVKQILA